MKCIKLEPRVKPFSGSLSEIKQRMALYDKLMRTRSRSVAEGLLIVTRFAGKEEYNLSERALKQIKG